MILGIGTDICNIERIEEMMRKTPDAFLKRILTDTERRRFDAITHEKIQYSYLAKRYAAKEALSKAIGKGFRQDVSWHDFEITNDDMGKPVATVSGQAAQFINQTLPKGEKYVIHISLSDDYPWAVAYAIIESV